MIYVKLDESQESCLRTVRTLMICTGAPEPDINAVLTRALALAAELAHGELIAEYGSEERVDHILEQVRGYPFGPNGEDRRGDPSPSDGTAEVL